jgi:hypothetical protein
LHNLSEVLLTLLLLLAISAGCSPVVSTTSTATSVSTSTTATILSTSVSPRFIYNDRYIGTYILSDTPAQTITFATSIYIAPWTGSSSPNVKAPTAVYTSLEDIGEMLLDYPQVTRSVILPDPGNPANLPAEMENQLQVFYGYYITIILTPTSAEAAASIYISVKNLMERTLITDITFYYAYRDMDGAVLKEGTVTAKCAARFNRGPMNYMTGETIWPVPAGLDIATTTAELKVISISFEPSY